MSRRLQPPWDARPVLHAPAAAAWWRGTIVCPAPPAHAAVHPLSAWRPQLAQAKRELVVSAAPHIHRLSNRAGAAFAGSSAPPETSKPSTPAGELPATTEALTEQIRALYEQHNPAKLPGLPKLLRKHAGKEAKLLAAVRKKYEGKAGL